MKSCFIKSVFCCVLLIAGCDEDDAWGVKDKKDSLDDVYLIVSEFRERDGEVYGYHRAAINVNHRNLDHVIYMQIEVTRTDPLCEDLSSGKLQTNRTIEWSWQLCDGYNSAFGILWADTGQVRIQLENTFIEKVINLDQL